MTEKKVKTDKIIKLDSEVSSVKGFGPKKAEGFRRVGIYTLGDILDYYPRSYEDLRKAVNICDIKDDDKVLVRGVVLLARPGKGYGRKRTLHLLVEDRTGRMEVLFFMAGFMKFEQGCEYRFFGKCKNENGRVTMFHPSYSKEDGEEGGILPVYPLTKGLSQKDFRKLSREALAHISELPESLPLNIVEEANIRSNAFAAQNIHYPENENTYKEARYRLVFEELFDLKAVLAMSKNRAGSGRTGLSFPGTYAFDFVNSLPYELTSAQKRVLSDVLADMEKPVAMNRLIQGDVGSGKTIIAQAAIVQAVKNTFQAAFMAPTEILAAQHYETLKKDFEPLGIKVQLITGSMTPKERSEAAEKLKSGEIQVAVGTHALISKSVEYHNLGLVITDEQHRFGVAQRQKLTAKGENPDILVMTATPIPRTLAAVLYADLDVSIIDELPPGRMEIITKRFDESCRKDAYKLALSEVANGHQVYIVAPLIEESDSVDGHSAEDLYNEFISKHKDISCALLHGQMKQIEKDSIMSEFYEGKISVLISTVVIEVGINVPNATVMLIENQERFGLAQLHQLRGRVGRGRFQSYCLLITGEDSDIAKSRAEIMCSSSDGFVIAEKDLEMRGPGEIFGYRQHGLPQLKVADPIKHVKIADEAGRLAYRMLDEDPKLEKEENRIFAEKLKCKYLQFENITL